MTRTPNPIPSRYRRVTPALVVSGADQALKFYAEVLGATVRSRFPGPKGTVAHAEIEIGDSVLIIEDEAPDRGSKAPPPGGIDGTPFHLFLYVEDVDSVFETAVKRGAKGMRYPENQFYGDRDGFLIDPFGHGWIIASHVEDVASEEMTRRMSELMRRPNSAT